MPMEQSRCLDLLPCLRVRSQLRLTWLLQQDHALPAIDSNCRRSDIRRYYIHSNKHSECPAWYDYAGGYYRRECNRNAILSATQVSVTRGVGTIAAQAVGANGNARL